MAGKSEERPESVPLRDQAESLAPFAVEIRYPGPMINVSHDEARGAMATAETAWQFVLSRLPEELHPYLIGPDNHVRPG